MSKQTVKDPPNGDESGLPSRQGAMVIGPPIFWKLVTLALIIAVSYLALTPDTPKRIDLGWDKLNHLAAFGSLAYAGYLACSTMRWKLALMVALILFGGGIEVLQQFVPGRTCDWGDLLADSIGVAMGALIAIWTIRKLKEVSIGR